MSGSPSPSPAFLTTRWSLVLRAANEQADERESREALEGLCRAYWHPLYCYLRRLGHAPDAAEDLTQELFAHLLSRPVLSRADRERGRFRSYLLGVLNNLLGRAQDRALAGKRGGGKRFVELDALDAEARYRLEPADHETPDLLFDRRWAATVMALAGKRLRLEYETAGMADRFAALKDYLVTGQQAASYAEAAAALNLTESAVKSAVFKLRQRFAAALRAEIAETVATEAAVEEEIRYLVTVLGA